MGPSAVEIERQIAGTRQDMEARIIELRERSRASMRTVLRITLLGVSIAAATGAAVLTGIAVYRISRPPTMGERVRRVFPLDRLFGIREKFELGARRGLPPLRLYLGDQQMGPRQEPSTNIERLVIKAAQAAGTAAAAAIVSRLVDNLRHRSKE